MEKPNYGIDALPAARNLALISLTAIVMFALTFVVDSFGGLRQMFLSFAISFLIAPVLMVLYAKIGKFSHRDRMLDMVNWRGDEQVLDVGTGRGLLMIGAAKHLTSGRVTGIDIWNAADLSGNRKENTLKNADLEGVAAMIDIRDEDARKMSFPDETFDVILSNLCLHNIPAKEGRREACREIARVLNPGGTAVLSDFKSNSLYESTLKDLGLKTSRSLTSIFRTFPPLTILKVQK